MDPPPSCIPSRLVLTDLTVFTRDVLPHCHATLQNISAYVTAAGWHGLSCWQPVAYKMHLLYGNLFVEAECFHHHCLYDC